MHTKDIGDNITYCHNSPIKKQLHMSYPSTPEAVEGNLVSGLAFDTQGETHTESPYRHCLQT